jgi:hypothetical protein
MCQGVEGLDHHISPGDGDVSFDDFMNRLGPWLPSAERCDIYGLGEVLLLPDTTFRIMRVLQQHHLVTSLVTNGALLTPNTVRKLAGLGLQRLVISVDAVTPLLYEEIRRGLRWSILDRNLRFLLGNEAIPQIEFNFVIMRRNLPEMGRLLDYIHEIHSCPSEIVVSYYLLQILKKNEFFRAEALYGKDENVLRPHFDTVQSLASRYGYRVNLPELVKLKQADQAFPDGPNSISAQAASTNEAPAGPTPDSLAKCSRPWDTFFLLPAGKGKICCDNPVPVQLLGDRNGLELQRLRSAVNDPLRHARYQACRFCAERPRSDYSADSSPPLELAFPKSLCRLHLNHDPDSTWQVVFPTLLGEWDSECLDATDWLVACRTGTRYTDLSFRMPAGTRAVLFLEYLDAPGAELHLFRIDCGNWVPLGSIQGTGSGIARQESFLVAPRSRTENPARNSDPLHIIIETRGAKFLISKICGFHPAP